MAAAGAWLSSWLLDLSATALHSSPKLQEYTGFVEDSGEGRWTIQAALEEGVPADVLSTALYTRFRSRQEHTFAEKMLSAMRKGFGGHVEQPRGAEGLRKDSRQAAANGSQTRAACRTAGNSDTIRALARRRCLREADTARCGSRGEGKQDARARIEFFASASSRWWRRRFASADVVCPGIVAMDQARGAQLLDN